MEPANTLLEADLSADPIEQFSRWFAEASASATLQPEAMTLSTAGEDGFPSARMVLLKDVNERGFAFFTNYESRKARELSEKPFAALTFWWPILERQVRAEGSVTRVPASESDEYFASRPRGSQIGAWASAQSTLLHTRADLELQVAEIERRFADAPVTRPLHWGGFRLNPSVVEFWQGRSSRLHDRLRYRRDGQAWKIERLNP